VKAISIHPEGMPKPLDDLVRVVEFLPVIVLVDMIKTPVTRLLLREVNRVEPVTRIVLPRLY
jgi:hypothetical protein